MTREKKITIELTLEEADDFVLSYKDAYSVAPIVQKVAEAAKEYKEIHNRYKQPWKFVVKAGVTQVVGAGNVCLASSTYSNCAKLMSYAPDLAMFLECALDGNPQGDQATEDLLTDCGWWDDE